MNAPPATTATAELPLGLTPADLPRWMRRARRGLDWGVLIVLLIGTAAAWPFIVHPALAASNQHEQFIYRAANMAQAFSEGLLYVRWSPHALYGFGAPLPTFTPPLPDYLTGAIQFFITGDPAAAVRIAFSLILLWTGLGVYALLLRRRDASTGVIGAALYVLSPVVAVTVPHTVGALDLSLALALLPALLWSVDRLLTAATPGDLALVSLFWAGLLLTHPPLAACALLLIGGYGLWLVTFSGAAVQRPASLIAALLIGGGLAACYWLPALLEADAVRWLPPVQPLPTFTAAVLFAPFPLIDPAAVNPLPLFTPGLAVLLAGMFGGLLLLRRRDHVSGYGAVSAVIVLGLLVLLPQQIALTGALTLALAISAAGLPDLLTDQVGRRRMMGAAVLAAAVIAAHPLALLPSTAAAPIDTRPAAQIMYQVNGLGSPLVPRSAAQPVTLRDPILPDLRLTGSYLSGSSGAVVIEAGGGDTFITPLETNTQSERFQVQTGGAVRLRLLIANFPGWEAALSGAVLPLTTDASGMLVVELPAYTSGELTIRLGTSPIRGISWVVTAFSLLILLLTLRRLRQSVAIEPPELRLLAAPISRLYGLTSALFMLFVIAAQFSGSTAGRNSGLLPPLTPLNATTSSGLTVLAATVPITTASPGGELPITLYWTASQPIAADYRAHVFLINLTTGSRWAFTSAAAPGSYPTPRWLTDRYVIDQRGLHLPVNLPPGEYTVGIEVFECTPDCDPATRQTFSTQETQWGRTLVLPLRIAIEPLAPG